jgi:hypothetical protein
VTTLTVNLSTALQTTLDNSGTTGIWAWAVYFNDGNVYSTQLAGTVGSAQQVNATTPIDLPGTLNGGKVYLLIQSVAPGGIAPLTFGAGNTIAQESDINWQNASSNDFRYDSFELSLLGQAGDAGNLTDVNGFGIPMSVSIAYPNGAATQTRGYAVNGSSVWSDINDVSSALVYTYSEGPLQGQNRIAASPATAVSNALPGPAATDWTAYVKSLGENSASGIKIAGYFNGAPSVEWTSYNGTAYSYLEYHNAGFYSYTTTYSNGVYTFTPDSNSQIKGTIAISVADLANSIYSTLGNATVTSPNGTQYQFSSYNGTVTDGPDMNTGANNQWGAFFVKLLTGFIGGYLGSTTTAQNSQLPQTSVSLSENWNFDPTFAFGGSIGSGLPGHVTPWSWNTTTYGSGVSYDPYAQIFFNNTNSYGNGYSDALMSLFQQGGPLIATGYSSTLANNPFSTTSGSSTVTVSDTNANTYQVGDLVNFSGASSVGGLTLAGIYAITGVAATSYTVSTGSTLATATATGGGGNVVFQKDVDAITLTLFDDNETAPVGQTLPDIQGYTPTEIYDTHTAPYVAPLGGTSTDLSFVIDFGLGQMRPDPDFVIARIGFYNSTNTDGQAVFDYIEIPSLNTLYQTWIFNKTSGTGGYFSAGGGPSPTGSILQLNGLPYDTGTNWYQIGLTNPVTGATRTYNLYAEATAGLGLTNPYYPGAPAGALAIDNLAQIPAATLPSTQQHTKSLNIAAFNGGTLSMDPLLLSLITDWSVISAGSNSATWPAPLTPVLGTLDGTTFSNWGGSTNLNTPNTGLNNVTSGELAIGWMGSDMTWVGYNASQSVNVIGSYTNKVSGLDVTQLVFTAASGTAPAPITATADIDGKWTTAATQFGNGTYSAVMTEYLATDTAFATPVNNASAALNFTVNIAELAFKNIGGSFIELDGSSGTAGGNWIRFETTSSTMPNGTLLAYATDANGNLIGRDGETGAGVTFDEAVLARIGMVATDGGAMLFSGAQSVYLKVGQQLHFAVQTGDGAIQQVPNVQVTGSADALAVKVNGSFGRLDLAATVDNTLSSAATLAGSQRQSDDPWIYLTQGQQTHVEVAGSAQNVNTIHFVQIDVNAATGAWSVGGVGYGNTDAFRSAVQANWDPGFGLTNGGGNFRVDANWAASSGPGYYAPVLVTQSGDIFVIGSANVDGRDHIRMYGENMFGFEDLRADQRADFDYNDLVMKLTLST